MADVENENIPIVSRVEGVSIVNIDTNEASHILEFMITSEGIVMLFTFHYNMEMPFFV